MIEVDRKIGYTRIFIKVKDKMDLLSAKTINCSAKYIKFNEIENKIFLDALSKSDALWDGKQEIFYMAKTAPLTPVLLTQSTKAESGPREFHRCKC